MSNSSGGTGKLVLSVVMPAFNEERLLQTSVEGMHRALDELQLPAEIIIVNDGSQDRTPSIADALSAKLPRIRAYHQANQGIGGAFRNGAVLASGEYLMLWPVDMQARAAGLIPYVGKFGEADVIVGCRRGRVGYNPLMQFNAWLYPRLVTVLFGLHLRDVNWIHAYRREPFLRLRLTQRGIPMLAETLVRFRDAHARFAEVEVDMQLRTTGVPSAARFSVMMRTLHGLWTFWLAWRKEAC